MKIEGCLVLVVDDNQNVGISISRLMSSCGAKQVKRAENGQIALEIIKAGFYPDFIITDYGMPIMNGVDMAQQIRATDKKMPIFMVSAHDRANIRLAAQRAGVNAYFIKPFNLDELLDAIERV